MALLNGETLLKLMEDVLTPEKAALLQAHPGLSWQVDALSAEARSLRAGLSASPADAETEAQRVQRGLTEADAVHDDAHRYFFKTLDANTHRGTVQQRDTIAHAQAVLYPDGLRIIGASYVNEAAAGKVFDERLQRDDVQTAFDILEPSVVDIRQSARHAVESTEDLDTLLKRLEALLVEGTVRRDERPLYQIVRQARTAWTVCTDLVQHLHGTDSDADRRARETLLGPWRAAVEATKNIKTPSDANTNAEKNAETPSDANTNV